jgi:hypothetical protein
MTYADEDAVKTELNKFGADGSDELTDALITRALVRADQMVKRKLVNTEIPTTVPEEVKEAATLYAVSRALDILYQDQEARSPTAVQNDKDADAILQGYIDEHPEETSGPTVSFMAIVPEDTDDPGPLW